MTWLPPLPMEQNGVLELYNITVHELNTGTTTRYWREADHNQLVISLLHPYYDYEVSIAATTVQTGVFTDPVTVRTLEAGKLHCSLRHCYKSVNTCVPDHDYSSDSL